MVPLVQGFALFKSVVALKSNQGPAQHLGQGFGQFGFAHTGLTFQEQGTLQARTQKNGGCQPPVRFVTHAG